MAREQRRRRQLPDTLDPEFHARSMPACQGFSPRRGCRIVQADLGLKMAKKWRYQFLTQYLTSAEGETLVWWCREILGEFKQDWDGYFLSDASDSRQAILMVDSIDHYTLLQLTWS